MRPEYSFICLCLIILASSCSRNKDTKNNANDKPERLSQYVYLDDNGTYHAYGDCYKLAFGRDDKGHQIYSKQPIDTIDLVAIEPFRVCTNCVNDVCYKQMRDISDRNEIRDLRRKILYDHFFQNYSEIPSRRVFFNTLHSDKSWASRIYDLAIEQNWFEGTYSEFISYYQI